MPVLRRSDGIPFALRSYRESLTVKNSSLLRRELFLLSQSHGHFARFLKQRNGKLEAIFSKDEGYLLGETIWQHFGFPENLIYCEQLTDDKDILTVIVLAGNIYLDAKLSYEELTEEFTTLFSSKVRYQIYVSGKVPLTDGNAKNKFNLAAEIVDSFQHQEASIFENLVALPQFQLLRFESAVEELKLGASVKKALITASILLVALLGIWYWLGSAPVTTEKAALDPYEKYSYEFANPDPTQQLSDLANKIILIQSLPGWLPIGIDYIAAGARVKVRTLGSPTQLLLAWAKKNGGSVDFTTEGAILMLPSTLRNRSSVPPIVSLTKTLSLVIDKMMQIIPGKSVAIGASLSQTSYKTNAIIITINKGSPVVLTLIGRALIGLPVTLTSSTFTLSNGLLTGTLQLTVLGN